MVCKKIPLDILTMEKLLEAADKQAPLVSTVPFVEFDENIFQQFMLKNPFGIFMVSQGKIIWPKLRLREKNLF